MREELLSVGIDIGTSTTQLIFSMIIKETPSLFIRRSKFVLAKLKFGHSLKES